MTIALARTQATALVASSATRASASAAATDAGAGDSGNFFAMLAALDIDPAAEPAVGPALALAAIGEDDPPHGPRTDTQLQQPPDLLQQSVPAANAALLMQAALPARDAAPSVTAAASPAADAAIGGVASAALAPVAAPPATTQFLAERRVAAAPPGRTAPTPPPTPLDGGAQAPVGTAPTVGVSAAASPSQTPSPDPLQPATSRPDPKQEALQAQPQLQAAARSTGSATAEPSVLMSMVEHELLARRHERTVERPSNTLPSADPDAGWKGLSTSAPPLLAPVDGAAASAAGTHTSMAERMVEQVSWWLSQKTQGAALTLNMPNGTSVSVNVQVQGNEAQVVFRSDHAEARHMLGDALPQLREMFGSEGLVLTGASVGSSASGPGGDAARHPPPTPGSRQLAAVEVPVDAAPARRQTTGRLDIYV